MSQIFAEGSGGKKRDEVEARRCAGVRRQAGLRHGRARPRHLASKAAGGSKDSKAGFNWLRRAALGGNVAAQNRIAKLYMQGIGTDPDTITAAAWYIVARRAGLSEPELDDLLNA